MSAIWFHFLIDPNAYDHHVLLGNYFGTPSESVTPLEGIRAIVSRATRVSYTDGCKHQGLATDGLARAGNLSEARSVAKRADVVVLCLGLTADIEGEQGDAGNSEAAGDKQDLALTRLQQVRFTLTPRDLSLIDDHGIRRLEPGRFRISVGGSQPDVRSIELLGQAPLSLELDVTGEFTTLTY